MNKLIHILRANLVLLVLVSISCNGKYSDDSITKQKTNKRETFIENKQKNDTKKIKHCNILKKDIQGLLDEWKRPVREIKCSNEKDKLEITLDFRSNYITVGSQHFIISLLIYKKFDTFKKFSNVEFTNLVSDDGFFNRTYNKDMIYDQFHKWNDRKRFYKHSVYSLKNMSPKQIISCNLVIERTYQAKSQYIDEYKNYWFLLDAFTRNCHIDNSESNKHFENFYLGVQWEKSGVPSQVIEHIFKTCGQ
jgi:hypothetical protein